MQSRRIAFVTMALLVAPFISIQSASADTKPAAPLGQDSTNLNSDYRLAVEKFRQDFKIYDDKRREINRIFKETIDKAMADARTTRLAEQTQVQRRQSMNLKQSVVIAATVARDAAIEALGSPPVAPTPPAKLHRSGKNRSPQPQISQTLRQ